MTDTEDFNGIAIDNSRDDLITDFGKSTLRDRYLLEGETFQQMFARVALSGSDDPEHAQRLYDYFSKHWAMPSTPMLSNLGTSRGHGVSCYLNEVEDNREGIFDIYRENCFLASGGGGIGTSWSNVRGIGAKIGEVGESSGIIPFLKIMDSATLAISQGSLRRGSAAVYLDITHPEIEEFLDIRKPTGGDINRKTLNLHHGICLTDKFMRAVERGHQYSLICPHTGNVVKKLDARTVWQKILTTRVETGEPYIIFIDTVNRLIPNFQKKAGLEVRTSNLCLTGDTKIVTDKGIITLDNLYNNQTEFSVSSDLRTLDESQHVCGRYSSGGHIKTEANWGVETCSSSKVFRTKRNADVFEIITKKGFHVKGTSDHKIMTTNGWVSIKDLNEGDSILTQSGEGMWSKDYNLPKPNYVPHKNWTKRYEKIRLDMPTQWSKEFGQIIGWLLGDGYIDNKNHWTTLVFGNNEINEMEYFRSLFNNISDEVLVTDSSNILHLKIMDRRFGEFLLQLGLTTNKAHKKKVPESIFTAPREAVIGFLQGLFTSDGTVNRTKGGCSIRLGSTSLSLLEDVQILLNNFGIVGTIYQRREKSSSVLPNSRGGTKEYPTKPFWELVLGKENRNKFAEMIGFISDYKQDNVIDFISTKNRMHKKSYRELFEDEIVSIEYSGKEDVYDITVDDGHSFIANGLVVHNCSEITLPTNKDRTAVCCLAQLNVEYYEEWKSNSQFIEDMVRFTDNVLSVFIKNAGKELQKAAFSASQERSIGIGVMGFHSYLQKLNIPFESAMAKSTNINMSKHIAEQCNKASILLANEKGPCPEAARFGHMVRCSNVTAVAPTASTSIIAGGTSPSGEPWIANAFTHKTLSGSFIVKNKFLERLLKSKGMNDEEVWKDIIIHEGSVQHLDFLSDDEKDVFKTAFELDQSWIVEHSSVRQQYVDQAISTNIFLPADVDKAFLHKIHFEAWKKGIKSLYYCRSKSIQRADKIGQQIEREIIEEVEKELSSFDSTCLGCE